jgi:hypothetical protein
MILLMLFVVFLVSAAVAVVAARAMLAVLFFALIQPREGALALPKVNPAL